MDPKYGSEKTLFKLQEQLLEVTRPLTCLWHDLLQSENRSSNSQIIHLLQRALVLVGGTSQAINVERRRIAWARINPKLKALADEKYEERKDNLFGPGFLEKASKKMDADKAINKVSLIDPTLTRGCLNKTKKIYSQRRPSPVRQQGETTPSQAVQQSTEELLLKKLPCKDWQSAKQETTLLTKAIVAPQRIEPVTPPLPISTPPALAGRVSHCLNNWIQLTTDPWILSTVEGYHIEWLRPPFQMYPVITQMREILAAPH